ncbi:MAG: hypothetical protein ACRENU_13575, partial [Gemmatimonadaceae bacterium]
MTPIVRLTLYATVLVLDSTAGLAQRTLIRAGQLLDLSTGQLSSNRTIVVERGRITSVDNATTQPADTVIDLSSYTV